MSDQRNRWTEKVSEAVARAIIEDIVDRDLEAGTRLPPESEMLEEYNVGRASLREALRILEVHGLIHIKPGRGGGPVVADATSVNFGKMSTLYFQASRATFQELMDARLVIEPMMAAEAARSSTKRSQEMLKEAVSLTHGALEATDSPAYLSSTSEFHATIMAMSGNRVLSLMGAALKDIFAERVSSGVFPPEYRERIAADHDAIAQAIFDGSPDVAYELMRKHMVEYQNALDERMPGLLSGIVDWR